MIISRRAVPTHDTRSSLAGQGHLLGAQLCGHEPTRLLHTPGCALTGALGLCASGARSKVSIYAVYSQLFT